MAFPYPEGYASRYAVNEEMLIDIIRQADKPGEEDLRCLEAGCGACDGHATERVVALIKTVMEE